MTDNSKSSDKIRKINLGTPASNRAEKAAIDAVMDPKIAAAHPVEVISGSAGEPVGAHSPARSASDTTQPLNSEPRKKDRRKSDRRVDGRLGGRRKGDVQPDKSDASNNSDRRRNVPAEARPEDLAAIILGLEQQARQAESEYELGYILVNAPRGIVKFRQAALLIKKAGRRYQVQTVSSLSEIDRNATFIRWMERLVSKQLIDGKEGEVTLFSPRQDGPENDPDALVYPFQHMALFPLKLRNGTVHAQLMCAREDEWPKKDLIAAARLCETFSHAWEALSGPAKVKHRMRKKSALMSVLALMAVGAMFIPVPLTVLAPAEVTAANAFVVAAPIDGVIAKIDVLPNSVVNEGDVLFSFSDTELRNRLELANQAVEVAATRQQQALRNSFADPRAKRELAIAKSEFNLKLSEQSYAKDLLDQAEVRAQRQGLILFDDKDSWTGRPVATGERIMRISDPGEVEISINLPVADAIVLESGTRVRLFLDADPLKSLEATLASSSYHARPDDENILSYQVVAQFQPAKKSDVPRIGLRGTAQLFGSDVSLGYFLFRKPLSVVRQWIGY